ncbi:protein SRC2-like [Rutidosis leptorrhynchoides]|uniref:protein SRC2-like n=1 Tax=Rutidosis leptorrhynchoides TaxID=125765 RepID=UPI003A99228E
MNDRTEIIGFRTLDLTLISAKGLKNHSVFGHRIDAYAVVSITRNRFQLPDNFQTPVDKIGGTELQWNYAMKFKVEEAPTAKQTLVIKLKGVRMFGSKKLGEVKVPIKELLEGVTNEGKSMQFVSYQLRKTSGKINGAVSFSYKLGEKFEEPVIMCYAPPMQRNLRNFSSSDGCRDCGCRDCGCHDSGCFDGCFDGGCCDGGCCDGGGCDGGCDGNCC